MRHALVGSRKRRLTSIVVGAFSAMALAALAYFAIGLIVGEGESSPQKLGTATEHREVNALPLTVKLNSPVETPGQKSRLDITFKNTRNEKLFIKSAKFWVTTSTPECKTEWFKFIDESNPTFEGEWLLMMEGKATLEVKPLEEGILSDGINGAGNWGLNEAVEFTSLPEVDQDPCESATFTVHAKVTTTNETH